MRWALISRFLVVLLSTPIGVFAEGAPATNTATPGVAATISPPEPVTSPFSGKLSVTNSVGAGTFVPDPLYAPTVTTSFTASGGYTVPIFLSLPQTKLKLVGSFDVPWIESYSSAGYGSQRQVLFADPSLTWSMGKLANLGAGFSVSSKLGLIAPVSVVSRGWNRILGFTAGVGLSGSWGDFSVGLSPAVTTWIHGQIGKTVACSSALGVPTFNPHNPDDALDKMTWPLKITRGQDLGNGQCLLTGRQQLAVLKLPLSFDWSHKEHSVSVAATFFTQFLRPLADNDDVHSPKMSHPNENLLVAGNISYSYAVPVSFDLALTAGVSNMTPLFDGIGRMNFPFFDVYTPASNSSSIYVDVTVGI